VSECPLPDVQAGRLPPGDYAARFGDATAPLSRAQAVIEAERCLYCHDAPCQTACPTGIDVPTFIHRIADGNLRGAARAILEANPLGGMCARVCPTEELCEQVCVRNAEQGKPIEIGRLQRHAVEAAMAEGVAPLFSRAAPTGKRIAVVGAGPAGLACAHTLARQGHEVVILDAHEKAGGLNEYGLASYKTAGDFAQREVSWLLSIGGITVQTGWRLSTAAQLDELRGEYDAVFLGLGLGAVNQLGLPDEHALKGVRNAVDFIAELRQSADLATLPIGRRVVVIGGGMTAVDAAVQAKLLGADEVTMVYRRGPEAMSASRDEQQWAQTNGVTIRHWLAPIALQSVDGHVNGITLAHQHLVDGRVTPTGEQEVLPADMVLKAIGQRFEESPWVFDAGLAMRDGRLAVDDMGKTSVPGVWAGGDCRAGGRDLTVEAVEDGKQAAKSIHLHLSKQAVLAALAE
jgi:glutamate synthase (NADPH/NADH) small chain